MERQARGGESPVCETQDDFMVHSPEYGGARETLSEAGSTTIQG